MHITFFHTSRSMCRAIKVVREHLASNYSLPFCDVKSDLSFEWNQCKYFMDRIRCLQHLSCAYSEIVIECVIDDISWCMRTLESQMNKWCIADNLTFDIPVFWIKSPIFLNVFSFLKCELLCCCSFVYTTLIPSWYPRAFQMHVYIF